MHASFKPDPQGPAFFRPNAGRVTVQQKLMQHSDIRTTMNVYGDVVTNEIQLAHSKVVQMALPTKPN
jgi:hypothetical protein